MEGHVDDAKSLHVMSGFISAPMNNWDLSVFHAYPYHLRAGFLARKRENGFAILRAKGSEECMLTGTVPGSKKLGAQVDSSGGRNASHVPTTNFP